MTPSSTSPKSAPSPARQDLFGIQIDAIKMPEAVERIHTWFDEDAVAESMGEQRPHCRLVVTPNVDHTVLLQENESFRQVYRDASLILADGHPIIWASRLLGRPLPERVTGSDLVPALFASVGERPLRVFLLGAMPGVGQKAAENIHKQYENVEVVGTYSPPYGFEKSSDENEFIHGRIMITRPDIVVVGLGAPKQELWVHRERERICASAALCVGATIDFLAGERKRAPRWMQSTGIEWLHRMCSEPKRLAKRYAKDAWVFPQIVFRQWREMRQAR